MQNSFSHSYVLSTPTFIPGSSAPGSLSSHRQPAHFEEPASRFVGRHGITRIILDRLAAGGGSGCFLVGEAGSGKTALIHHVLSHCSPDVYVVHVRGSAFSGRTAFGALTFLLSDLEPDVAAHPVLILRGLTRLVQERAQGRTILLVVDNAEELDEFSAMALSQMVLSRTAGILACFRDFSRAPAEFTGLWREGILSRVDLEPLDLAETTELVSADLGGPVSGTAVEELYRHTGGNPHLLTLGCADYRDSGALRLSRNVWVLDPRKSVPAGRVADTILSRLEELTEHQLALVRTVALAGSLPLATAMHNVEAGEMDDLQEQGILTVERHGAPRILIRDKVLAGALAVSLDEAARKTLLQDLRNTSVAAPPLSVSAGAVAAGGDFPAAATLSPDRLATWQLGSGEALDPGAAVCAARAANAEGDAAGAIRFITSLEDFGRSPEAVLELVTAHMMRGDYGAALSVLSSYRVQSVQAAPLLEAKLLIAENRVLCIAATGALSATVPSGILPPGAAKTHEELLKKAEQLVAGLCAAGTLSRAETMGLEQALILARTECNSTHGRFLENAAYLAPLRKEISGRDKGFRVLVGSWLCEALGMTDRQDDAVELARDMEQLLGEPGISQSERTRSFARIFHMYLGIGSLNSARRILGQQPVHGQGTLFPGLLREVGEGVLHAYAGDPAPALARLIPAVEQLRVSGPEFMLPLAAAATAYCLALERNGEDAQAYLEIRSQAADGGPWTVRRAARHFAALAGGALGLPQAAQRFIELAGHDHRRGAYSYELLSLFNAARLGDLENLDRLLNVAAHQQSPIARLSEIYAKGVGGFDAQLLVQAGEMGAAAGHVHFAQEASERALAVAAGAGDRATVRSIHRSRRGAAAAVVEDRDSADEYLGSLTFRERSIARMAAGGTSNKAIAAELNISVRTVEGHLYQVYSKLHVGSRRELAKVIADKSVLQK